MRARLADQDDLGAVVLVLLAADELVLKARVHLRARWPEAAWVGEGGMLGVSVSIDGVQRAGERVAVRTGPVAPVLAARSRLAALGSGRERRARRSCAHACGCRGRGTGARWARSAVRGTELGARAHAP